jgi:hypothetical protein
MRKGMCYEIRNSYGSRITTSEIFRILFSIRAIIETQLKLTFIFRNSDYFAGGGGCVSGTEMGLINEKT